MTDPRHRLWLHIGHPKCASSTIQSALARNADRLRAAGVLVGDADLCFPEQGPVRMAPAETVAALIERGAQGLADATARFQRLDAQLGGRFTAAVLSAESLCMPGAEYLGKALRHAFDVQVVYYIRAQEDLLLSAWNQWGCKEGVTLRDYLERQLAIPQPNYERVIERWQPVCDGMRVRPLHPAALAGGDVVHDLFSVIGAGFAPVVPSSSNRSLDVALLEVFADSPFLFESIHDTRLGRWLERELPERFVPEKASLEPQWLERIRARFAEQNERLRQRWFPDVDDATVMHGRSRIAEPPTDAQLVARLRRVVGLQFALLQDLGERVERLERGGGSSDRE